MWKYNYSCCDDCCDMRNAYHNNFADWLTQIENIIRILRCTFADEWWLRKHCNFCSSDINCVRNCDPNLGFFFLIVPRPGPAADPSRNWSGPATMDSPRPVLRALLSLLVTIELTKNREPRRAILRLATNPKPSCFKADAFSTFYSAFEASSNGRTWFLASPFVSPLCLGLVFLTITSLLYVVYYRLVKANIRSGSPTRKSRSTASFPFPVFDDIFLTL